MPELPEVETIARALNDGGRGAPPIKDRKISAVDVLWPRTLATPQLIEFKSRLVGQVIHGVKRRGKFLCISLECGFLYFHLRMSGDMRVQHGTELQTHDRLVIDFIDGWRLAFNDPRKFGRAWLVDDPEEVVGDLGPEPLDPELTPAVFWERLHQKKRQLKPLLLDQSFLAGLGNIYSDEALHLAKLHPLRSSETVTQAEAALLLKAIRIVIEEGIRRNGASIDWVYRGGDFQNYFRAYQRTGERCPECGTAIQRIVVGQRSTHFCPECQKL
ncbi:MAG TPA: bifunctional DNA-formamidopyrimidine glycosylase/DNA-(apurinic or apyrimidinic site) lyase [Longilinea sp.]|nr:bifunctional DNA-formamidopyrimidine glycosylase/DNA-(apurinic or apyrimidinic site) lyase [Longilinea sp.]